MLGAQYDGDLDAGGDRADDLDVERDLDVGTGAAARAVRRTVDRHRDDGGRRNACAPEERVEVGLLVAAPELHDADRLSGGGGGGGERVDLPDLLRWKRGPGGRLRDDVAGRRLGPLVKAEHGGHDAAEVGRQRHRAVEPAIGSRRVPVVAEPDLERGCHGTRRAGEDDGSTSGVLLDELEALRSIEVGDALQVGRVGPVPRRQLVAAQVGALRRWRAIEILHRPLQACLVPPAHDERHANRQVRIGRLQALGAGGAKRLAPLQMDPVRAHRHLLPSNVRSPATDATLARRGPLRHPPVVHPDDGGAGERTLYRVRGWYRRRRRPGKPPGSYISFR